MQKLESRVDSLENIVKELVKAQIKTEKEIQDLAKELRNFKNEMKAFKDDMLDFKDEMLDFKNEMKAFKDDMLDFKEEMRAFKDEILDFKNEMKAFKDEMKAFKDEMLDFKNEMKAFKDEMLDFKEEMRAFKEEMLAFKEEMKIDRKNMNKQWGELANKMGTVVEDIVAPNIPRIAKEYFGCLEIEDFMIRRKVMNKLDRSKKKEFDVIAVCEDKIIINGTKSTANVENARDFINSLNDLFDYFPEYRSKEIIPVFSSLYIPENVIGYLSKNKVYAMAMNEDTMDILNPELKM